MTIDDSNSPLGSCESAILKIAESVRILSLFMSDNVKVQHLLCSLCTGLGVIQSLTLTNTTYVLSLMTPKDQKSISTLAEVKTPLKTFAYVLTIYYCPLLTSADLLTFSICIKASLVD
jgi:hypothetical protein